MRASQVKFTSRLIIALIVLVFLSVLLDYLITWRKRAQLINRAPQLLSSEMIRSVDRIEYSDNRNGVLRFRIRAQRLLESRRGKSFLQGIEACDFNPDGSIRNEIRSQSAEYDREQGFADFSGAVRLFFSEGIELRTDSLRYNLISGVGETQDSVQFHSRQASGKARGVRFDQKHGHLEFKSEVDFSLSQRRTRPGGETGIDIVHARSNRAFASKDARRILLAGNVRLESSSADLYGERVEAVLSSDGKRLTSLTAEGRSFCRFKEPNRLQQLSGRKMQFVIGTASHALEIINVLGEAELSSQSPSGEENLSGREIQLELDPVNGFPVRMQCRTGVRFQTKRGMEQTFISAEHLSADFMPGTKAIESLQVSGHARLSMGGTADASIQELEAEEIRMSFRRAGEQAAFEKLRASGSARWTLKPQQRKVGARREPARILEASLLEVFYSAEGGFLDSIRASGRVAISELPAERSVLLQMRRLFADDARFYFFPQDNHLKAVNAEGHVRIIYEKNYGSGGNAEPHKFQTESEKMEAFFDLEGGESRIRSVSQQGNFRYLDATRSATAGRSDYDAGREILVLDDSPAIAAGNLGSTTGERIEFDQKQKLLSVYRRVRSRLGAKAGEVSLFGASPSSPSIITANELRYWMETGRTRYAGNVQLLSESGHLRAEVLDIAGDGLQVDAQGNITHMIFINGISASGREHEDLKGKRNSDDKPMMIKSSKLSYSKEGKAISYIGNVSLYSKDVVLYSAGLDALMDAEGEKITHAKAEGQVRIYQGDRVCKGETAEYYLDPGKFVILGNPAEIFDPGKGRSFARRLTSFTADDRILIEKQ